MAVCKGRCSIPTISPKIRGPWTVQYLKITLKKQQQTLKNNNNNVLFSPQQHLSSTSLQVKRPSSISSCPLKTDETIALVTEKVRKMDARFVRNRTWISSSRKFIGREDFLTEKTKIAFTTVVSRYADCFKQKKVFTWEKSQSPQIFSFFRFIVFCTIIATVTSSKYYVHVP